MSEAKKYQCRIVTGYYMGFDKWHETKAEEPIIVAATSPNEARLRVQASGAVEEALAKRPPVHVEAATIDDPEPEVWELKLKQITAKALKEAAALEVMGAPSLFDLGAYDKHAKRPKAGDLD